MKYLLDTNTCVRYLNGRAPHILSKLPTVSRADIAVSAVTKAELFFGSAKSQTPERSRQKQDEFLATVQSLPFDDSAAEAYGQLRAYLERQGRPIGGNDLLIAATALVHDLILVTHNTAEFERVPELMLEDWELEA
jgi:tRNA(fMet)-specific endonuclease VapC